MALINREWENANENRDYPIDESSSCIDDNGVRLPQDVLVDACLVMPFDSPKHLFVSSLTITSRWVTITLSAAHTSQPGLSDLQSIATLSLEKSQIVVGRPYAVSGRSAGISGYVVFGKGIRRNLGLVFSTPSQSRLAQRSYRLLGYRPVAGMGRPNCRDGLRQLIGLQAESPLEIVYDQVEIDDRVYPALRVRLTDKLDPSAAADISVLQEFSGPCSSRPDSRTCPDPQPIEYLGSVSPDCEGFIEIELSGGFVVGQNVDDGSLVIEYDHDRSEICQRGPYPTPQGVLPGEVEDPAYYDLTSIEDVWSEGSRSLLQAGDGSARSFSVGEEVLGSFPVAVEFSDFQAVDFVPHLGSWTFIGDLPYDPDVICYTPATITGGSRQNATLWHGFDITTLNRAVETSLKFSSARGSTMHNGGLIINYQESSDSTGRWQMILAVLDYDKQALRLLRWTGGGFQSIFEMPANGLRRDVWYTLRAVIRVDDGYTEVKITVSVSGPNIDLLVGPILVPNYSPADGLFGLWADCSHTRFLYFSVDFAGA